MKTFKPYDDNTDTAVIIDDEGKQTDLHIGGILTKENIPETGFSEALPDSIRIVVPNAQVRYFDWYSATCDEEGFSVGMTGKSLRKMVYCESLFCLLKAILPGTLFGLLIPWGNIFFGIIFVTVVVMCITYVEMGREKDRNIIAEIRMDTM